MTMLAALLTETLLGEASATPDAIARLQPWEVVFILLATAALACLSRNKNGRS